MSTNVQAPSREGCALPSKGWAFGNVPVAPASIVSRSAARLHALVSKAPWSHCRICIAIDVVVLAAALVLVGGFVVKFVLIAAGQASPTGGAG